MDRDVADRLAAARSALARAEAAAGPPPELHAAAPLRPVSPEVQARMVRRALAGRAPIGRDHPRRGVWLRTVAPLAVITALDAFGVAVALGNGAGGLAVFALVAFVVLGGLAVLGARFALADPLRFTAAQHRELAASRTWTSTTNRDGPLAASPHRALVVAATQAVGRIVASPALASPALDAQRTRLDLVDELDGIDAQAAAPAQWDAALSRVAALRCYADELDAATDHGAGGVDESLPPAARVPHVSRDAVARLGAFLDVALSPVPSADTRNR